MSGTQDLLSLPSPVPKVKPEEVSLFVSILEGARDWITAGEIQAIEPRFNDRRCRAIAEAAPDVILSFPGSPGYRLIQNATLDELWHARNSHESQMRRHISRVLGIDRMIHRRRVA